AYGFGNDLRISDKFLPTQVEVASDEPVLVNENETIRRQPFRSGICRTETLWDAAVERREINSAVPAICRPVKDKMSSVRQEFGPPISCSLDGPKAIHNLGPSTTGGWNPVQHRACDENNDSTGAPGCSID